MDIDAIVLAGYLEKSPPLHKAASGLKAFKRRWFVLRRDSHLLSYYETSDTRQPPKGTIDMTTAVRVEGSHTWPGPEKARHPWVFIIETTEGRVYYLSASSKDTMDNWVDRLHRVFLRELMTNARGSEDESVLRNFAQGVLAVDTSLVSAVTLAVNVQVEPETRCSEVLEKVVKKVLGSSSDSARYLLAQVDKRHTTQYILSTYDKPLQRLKGDPTSQLFLVPEDVAGHVLRLLQVHATQAQIEYARLSNSAHVSYLGHKALDQPCDSTELYRQAAAEVLEQFKKQADAVSSALGKRELELLVSEPSLKLVCQSQDPGRPFLVLREIRMVHVIDAFDFDRNLLVLVVRTAAPPLVHGFRCNDKAAATKLRYIIHTFASQATVARAEAFVAYKNFAGAQALDPPQWKRMGSVKDAPSFLPGLMQRELDLLLQTLSLRRGTRSMEDISAAVHSHLQRRPGLNGRADSTSSA